MVLREIERREEEFLEPPIVLIANGREDLSTQILARHKDLSTQVDKPYFEVAKGTGNFEREDLGSGLIKDIGPIEAFDPEVIACYLETALKLYKKEGTMGDLPTGGSLEAKRAERELRKVFIGGFNKDVAVVIIHKLRRNKTRVIVGGIMIKAGNKDIPIVDLIGKPQATIPTLSALQFDIPPEISHIGNIHESHVFCPTKLCSVQADEFGGAELGKERSKILPELVIGAEQARAHLEKYMRRHLYLGIADIHEPNLLDFVFNFGWELVTDETQPTNAILSTVLKHHYNFYKKDVKVIFAEKERLIGITKAKLGRLRPQKAELTLLK